MSPTSAIARSAAEAGTPTQIPMLIGGEWRVASDTYEVRDPYRGSIFEIAPRSTLPDLDDALAAAVAAKGGSDAGL
jgi:acyl-CoA reductase-like NAD-dependent aldehyde dehydrogenase